MMGPWITFEDLCSRWNISKHNLAYMFINGKLQAYDPDDFYCYYKCNEEFIRESPNREHISSSRTPPTVDEVATYIFSIVKVIRYERKRGIIPRKISADIPEQAVTEDPDATQQSHNDKPLFTVQTWEEVNRLYDLIKDGGFKVPNIEKKLRFAAKNELTNNKNNYQVIKKGHLACKDLFALNTGQERRDFVGKLLQIITSKSGQKKIGAQRLYAFGKKNYQNKG